MKRMTHALCLLVAIALAVAGCGGGDSTSSGGAYAGKGGSGGEAGQPASSDTSPSIAVVSSAEVGDLGRILVDAEGRTLYDFQKDKHGRYVATASSCYGACAEAWPPLLTGGEPEAEGGPSSTKLGTLKRKDGTLQVTYFGHPLYTYAGDEKPGEANGNDVDQFGAEWYALQPNGEEPEDAEAQEASSGRPEKGSWGVVFGAEGEHGIILYDLSGHTLYIFSKDQGGKSSCYGGCAKAWPPALTEGKAKADGEANPAKVGTTKRTDGTVQLTYAGHPLYTYSGDKSAEVSGQGVKAYGGRWYAIRPSGEPL